MRPQLAKYKIAILTKSDVRVESDSSEFTDEEFEKIKEMLDKVMGQSHGYVSMDSSGSKIWVPITSIDHLGLLPG